MVYDSFTEKLDRVLGWRDSQRSLAEILERVPRIDAVDLPAGSVVVVRADVDVVIKDGQVVDDVRLKSCLRTLEHARERGWIVVMVGHIGRDPQATLRPVQTALAGLLGSDVEFVSDWLSNGEASSELRTAVRSAGYGSFILCENTRKYEIERSLWDAVDASDSTLVASAERTARSLGDLADLFVNEAIAASNPDFSSTAVPLSIANAALGYYLHSELAMHVQSALQADFVVFSGVKANKLDDLELLIRRPGVRHVVVAGALAAGMVKAAHPAAQMGRAESDPTYVGYVSAERMAQSARIVEHCAAKSIELILPVDFVLETGEIAGLTFDSHAAQMDVGPATSDLLDATVTRYLSEKTAHDGGKVLFYNGVFGLFEDPRFEAGTRRFVERLAEITSAGVRTYVGGGEGRAALLKYGNESDVTHAFTAGGTILKLLGGRSIPYLEALVAAQS